MNRALVLKVHLILSAVFIPLLLLVPLSGSLYLLGIKGDSEKTEVLTFAADVPSAEAEKVLFFRRFFEEQKIDFDFEYIKETPAELIFRPTSRDHYTAKRKDGRWTLVQVRPSLLAKLMELHKGHGPQRLKYVEAVFGIALILVLSSGLWLALSVAKYRRLTLASALSGALLFALLL